MPSWKNVSWHVSSWLVMWKLLHPPPPPSLSGQGMVSDQILITAGTAGGQDGPDGQEGAAD